MIRTVFHAPNGNTIENIELEIMRKYIIDDFNTYWLEGSGDGFIDLYTDDEKVSTMTIGPNVDYGIYLHVIEYNSEKEWLSVYNKEVLDEVVETADEIFASIGLFVPIEIAWKAIQQYLLQETLALDIDWKEPDVIPEYGNC